MVRRMKPIALFFVVTACLIEAIGFGWIAVEFWPDAILSGVAVAALLICLPMNFFTGRVIDRRLRQLEDSGEAKPSTRRRSAVVERM